VALGEAVAVRIDHQAAMEPGWILEAQGAVEQKSAAPWIQQVFAATTSVIFMAASSATQASW